MALYHKHRPKDFKEIKGNDAVVNALETMFAKNKVPHALLFVGNTGCGKTTLARIVSESLGAVGNDIREMDIADFRGIDTVREIRKQSQYKPLEGACRVWIMDEVHKMTNDAQNALLKILEDTPAHVYFILCTTDPQKLLPAIKGRCSTFQVNPLNDTEMFTLLRTVVKAEEETLVKAVYEQIIHDSLGHPRNALQVLEQVLQVEPEKRLDMAKRAAEQQSQSIELCRALMTNVGWLKIAAILSGLKEQDPEGVRRHVLGYVQSILLKQASDKAALIIEEFKEPFYNSGFTGLVFACYNVTQSS